MKNKFFTREICVCVHLTQTRYAQKTCAEMRNSVKVKAEDMQLYAVTDTQWLNGRDFLEVIESVLANGATFLQLREKNATHEEIVAKAKAIKPIAKKYGVPFVIDDDIYAAKEADVDGVHIGQNDASYEKAREVLGEGKIIGMTVKTRQQAENAIRLGADYVGMGAVFHTSTKKDAKDMSRETLLELAGMMEDIPVVAIGGISYDNCDYLKDTGVDGIAVVSAIFASDDCALATRKLFVKTRELFGKKRNIIMDMDGTLADSMPFWKNSAREYAILRGADIPDNFDEITGVMDLNDYAEYVKNVLGIDTNLEQITEAAVEIMNKHYEKDIPAKDGMTELVTREYKAGSRLVVFTASDRRSVEILLSHLGIRECFYDIYTVYDVGLKKSDKNSYLKVAELAGMKDTSQVWVYEDILRGVKAAKEAGLNVCAVYDEDSAGDWEDIKELADKTLELV
ncbi:thiamine-phosphate pyrophosphorylase [Eubacterium sp. CAG:252]|nr:thiamine-phosphate pyrophosphorylase [Eubacterium sp. CAG:252]